MNFRLLVWALLLLTILHSCETVEENATDSTTVGAQRLLEDEFELIQGKRVGIITNHSAVVGESQDHIVDLLHDHEEVEVTALFGPEHGIRGEADAGEPVDDEVDEETGIPVYSLYGDTRYPTEEMLEDVDVLLFDIQDVGTRFYTYPATMGRAMKSAAKTGIPYLVLDRPNPIGGERIEGHIREDEFESGIGLYPTPITHGMTVGELALMIKDNEWHEGISDIDLHVVEMEGWTRDMFWEDSGLDWVPPSPNIPDVETAIIYPGTCLFEGTNASEGRGTYEPFLQVGSPYISNSEVADDLNNRDLPGLYFNPAVFVPESIEGMSTEPKLEGEQLDGVKIDITESRNVRPVEAGIHIMQAFYENMDEEGQQDFFIERGMSVRAGNKRVQQQLEEGVDANEIVESWQEDVDYFKEFRKPYLLYE